MYAGIPSSDLRCIVHMHTELHETIYHMINYMTATFQTAMSQTSINAGKRIVTLAQLQKLFIKMQKSILLRQLYQQLMLPHADKRLIDFTFKLHFRVGIRITVQAIDKWKCALSKAITQNLTGEDEAARKIQRIWLFALSAILHVLLMCRCLCTFVAVM